MSELKRERELSPLEAMITKQLPSHAFRDTTTGAARWRWSTPKGWWELESRLFARSGSSGAELMFSGPDVSATLPRTEAGVKAFVALAVIVGALEDERSRPTQAE